MTARSICIATPDIVGPIRNGGIGTACFEIAKLWRAAGHEVTILYANDGYQETPDKGWLRVYDDLGITFVMCPEARQSGVRPILQRPWNVWQWLKTRRFDVVYFPEWRAAGLYAIQAKRAGLDFQTTTMIVGTHSPTNWHSSGGMHFPESIDDIILDSAERQAVALADVVISPSLYMLDHLRREAWVLPEDVRMIPNPFSIRPSGPRRDPHEPIDELVFFGRLERRKGLMIFVKALAQLPKETAARLKVTFLGKPGDRPGWALSFIAESRPPGFADWRTLDNLGSHEALAYLQGRGRLAVMPSLTENSPMTVRECIALGIPFLAAKVGGIPELVAEDNREAVLFEPRPLDLVAAIVRAVGGGAVAADSAFKDEDVASAWRAVAERVVRPARSDESRRPRVSVVVTTFNRPRALAEALQGLRAQTWQPLEVVVVDDGSTDPAALAQLDGLEAEFRAAGWTIIRQGNQYLGAARNAGWRAATGDLVIFHDDDNYSPPDLVETYVRAILTSGADIATCTMAPYRGERPAGRSREAGRVWAFVGNGTGMGLYLNGFGDAHACFRRSALEATGGFTEDYGVGHEDWEIFGRASLMGLTIVNVPEPLFWYRESDDAMLRGRAFADVDFVRSLRPYLDAVPGALRPALQFALSRSLRVTMSELDTTLSVETLCLSILPAHLRSERALREACAGPTSWRVALRALRLSYTDMAVLRRLGRVGAERSETMDLAALAFAALPRQMRSRERILDLASFRQSWQRIAFRHPYNISYWLAARRLQRAARKMIWS
ncbi:glycosyltransferase [Prosthecomicrobium pneumaticum]|uniref:Glycosyltransferase involved in cell wall biosynthesis n=1 Tax=Prosthecomicrobium pneumaticum TaxID=81895 RepID=A0A7W9FQS2_9HYPH|nr:glycosyltransferase [Prosthecomicrobium pneumaticum]MBB5755114.1 glycosyltransferase involved in cell wall biosynthesis [Prosthecomicrobium pneumaticum]